mmetsp:Transcript_14739/g.17008  ORF Transcript_14739/g.17008 Transcript_14739/m.17008 type:complete len:99 (+) Transcript_14739:558-854(+)
MFAVELQRTDTNFTEIFDEVLTQLGERAQQTAIERYNLKQQQIAEKSNVLQIGEGRRVTDADLIADKMRLWAFVDMMIQSKTLVKRANGTLGSKSVFG